jgi:hypothetical protein
MSRDEVQVMTADNRSAAGGSRDKLDDDDHDLLTFGEAAERLRIEIDTTAARIADLERLGDRDELAKVKIRLAALEAAASRNAAQQLNDANFEKFFGYPGKATRNLPGPTSK